MSKWKGGPPPLTNNPVRRPYVLIDAEWQRWVAENLLRGSSEQSMLQAMINAGVEPNAGLAEIRAAMQHPYLRAARLVGGGVPRAVPGSPQAKIEKRDWVLECYRRAARLSTTYGRIERVPRLARQQFLDGYYATSTPVVMTGAMDDWPAMTKWTNAELKRRFGERLVSVQANRTSDANYEQNSQKLRREMRFGEFIDLIESAGETNDMYITANNAGTNHLALKELWDDIVYFPEYLRPDPENKGFFWFGPKGTVTPLHHDLTNNFMAQVRGRKLVRLIAPYELPSMYNNRHCFTQVDLDRVDYEKYPAFRNVTVMDVEIGPGDLLFLPVGWWHYVRGLEVSITMTFTNFVFDNDFYSMYTTYQDI